MIEQCLIPVGGYGSRFLPVTKSVPKEMLPVLDKPLVQYGVEECYNAGINKIAFVTGRNKEAIENYFDINYELDHQLKNTDKYSKLNEIRELISNCKFNYTRQNHPNGLGHAIICGEGLVSNNPFAVILPDDLCHTKRQTSNALTQLIKVYEKYKTHVVGFMEVDKSEVQNYGILDGTLIDDNVLKVSEMIEKPDVEHAPSQYAIIGRYILRPSIFEVLKSIRPGTNGEIQLTDALREEAKHGKVMGCLLNCTRFDCGSIDGFVSATNYFYEIRKNLS